MLILIGASASGKTEIVKKLIQDYGYKKMVTTTTRRKRENEVNHVDYHFISKKRFLELKSKNKFLETVEYNNHYYGTPIEGATKEKVLIVEPSGANSIYEKKLPDTIFFLLHTDEEIRKTRMLERGDNLIQIMDRLEKDDNYFNEEHLDHIDFTVDTSNFSIDEITEVIHEMYQNCLEKRH